jgi:hypothetical protein
VYTTLPTTVGEENSQSPVWNFQSSLPVVASREYIFISYDPKNRLLPDMAGDVVMGPSVWKLHNFFPEVASNANAPTKSRLADMAGEDKSVSPAVDVHLSFRGILTGAEVNPVCSALFRNIDQSSEDDTETLDGLVAPPELQAVNRVKIMVNKKTITKTFDKIFN